LPSPIASHTPVVTSTMSYTYLSAVIKSQEQPQLLANQYNSTLPHDSYESEVYPYTASQNAFELSKTFTTQEALVKPVVFVINLTAYEANGAPIDDVVTLNNQMIAAIKEATIYHGYLYSLHLKATFLGQDGEGYAGAGCSTGTDLDNVHIHLTGIKTDIGTTSFRVNDYAAGGVWATPCDPVSNWLLYVMSDVPGEADIYFKPFRDAPEGTIYSVSISYDDGSIQTTTVVGSHVSP
jgi:hypothetical protein